MKNLSRVCSILVLVSLFIIPTSCMYTPRFPSIIGTGDPVDKNYKVSDFHGIDVSGGFDVILVQGNSEDLTITAQENLFEYFIVKVEQGILRIYIEKTMLMPTKPMTALISFKSIDNLEVSGGGDVECNTPVNVPGLDVNISGGGDLSSTINADELKCHISGGGDAQIDGNIKKYIVNLSGGGDVRSDINTGLIECIVSGGGDIGLRCKEEVSDAKVSINGGGDITLDMNVEKLKCSVSGGGDVTLTGQASGMELEISGGGNVNAGSFLTETTLFNVSGGSDIRISASKELKGTISGGGDVYYSGNTEVVNIDARGGSKVYKE